MLEGMNFLIVFDGVETLTGFIATRWVKARTPEEAELLAVKLIRKDNSLIDITCNVKDETLAPKIFLDELLMVSWFTYFRKRPGKGYTFYKQES
jgi:hypothetical protein